MTLETEKRSLNEPFGDTDASRARSVENIDKVGSEGFVKISVSNQGGISNGGENRYRVIVGKKGSGKTLYLRRLYIKVEEESNYSENINHVLENLIQTRPQSEHILRFSQLFSGEFLTEKWRELWRRAILRTIITHIQHSKKLINLKRKLPADFNTRFKKILSKSRTPITVFSQVIEIINSSSTNKDFNRFCDNILWAELDSILGPIIKDGIPLYFYIDAIDEEYQHAPMYWMRAQKGLFYCVMQFLRDEKYGGKLHIMISIRDHVFSSVLQSEHETRYIDKNHISILKWDADSAKYLLEQKLKFLDSKYFVLEGDKEIYNWVGLKEISNKIRKIKEPFVDYLIRHTRAIPRDIIVLGNTISSRICEIRSKNIGFYEFEDELREIISDSAKRFAEEQLQIASNHLTSNLMPSKAVELGIDQMFTSGYTGDQEYLNLSNLYKEKINNIIQSIGKDRFSNAVLMQAKQFAKEIFEINSDLNVFDILWQNDLIGYSIDSESSIFFDEMSTEFKLPLDKENYVFHTILIDKLNLTPVGLPVKIKYHKY